VNLLAAPQTSCLIESQPLRRPTDGNAFVALPTTDRRVTRPDGVGYGGDGSRGRAGALTDSETGGGGSGGGGKDGSTGGGDGESSAHLAFDDTYAELCSILGIRYVLTPTSPDWSLPPAALADALATACDRRKPATLRHPPRGAATVAAASDGRSEAESRLPQPPRGAATAAAAGTDTNAGGSENENEEGMPQQSNKRRLIPPHMLARQGWVSWD
jgi:hypothetical protein